MTEAEEQAMREHEAQHYFGISAEERLRRWYAGEYEGIDSSGVVSLAILYGLA